MYISTKSHTHARTHTHTHTHTHTQLILPLAVSSGSNSYDRMVDSSPPLSGDETSEMNPSVTHFDLDEDVSKATGVEYFFASDAR